MSDDAWETFAWPQAPDTMKVLADTRRQAIVLGRKDIQIAISRIGVELQRKLDTLSRVTATRADEAIRRRLRQAQRRPLTNRPVHLADQIKSVPFMQGLGFVKVALIDELNQAINPSGYGPYWRAIEYGSVEVGNIMTGRRLYGTFEGPGGYSDAPREALRRDYIGKKAIPPGAEFAWGDNGDALAGKGVIHNEIEGRHFLEKGTDEAWAYYAREIREIDHWAAKEIAALSGPRR